MSTKIYAAYRLKHSRDLWPLVHDIRAEGIKRIKRKLREIYRSFAANVDVTSQAFQTSLKHAQGDETEARLRIAGDAIQKLYKAQSLQTGRDMFDFDVSIGVHAHKRRLYLIPYCDMQMRRVLDFLKKEPRLENYAYWDNTDKPRRVTAAAWEARARVWNVVGNRWQDMLMLELCSVQSFWQLDPCFEMVSKRF